MLDVQRYVVHRVRQQIADPAATTHVRLQQRVLRYRNSRCCSHNPRPVAAASVALSQQSVLQPRPTSCCSSECCAIATVCVAATTHVLLQQRVLRCRNSRCCSHDPRPVAAASVSLSQQSVLQRTACIRTRVHLARLCACLNVAAASHAFGRVHRLAHRANVHCPAARAPSSGSRALRRGAAVRPFRIRRIAAAVEPGHVAHSHRLRASEYSRTTLRRSW
jgi:hypothetical protein